MIIAAAQTVPKNGDIAANLDDHYRLTAVAAEHGARLIIFPEMSLTGYRRSNAMSLSLTMNDERLAKLQDVAIKKNIIIVAGAPMLLDSGLHIGAFILSDKEPLTIYTKQYLHEGEEEFFSPNLEHDPKIPLGGEICSLAICADIANPLHPEHAASSHATIYLASLFYTPTGIIEGHADLSNYAKTYGFGVLMANYGGPSWGMATGGKSAVWDGRGTLQASLEGAGEGLIIAEKRGGAWTGRIVRPDSAR
jgi:predicted amidohydrolase